MSFTARAERWGLLACIAVAGVSFLPVLGFGFVYDDNLQLVSNPNVHTWHGLATAFSEHVWSFDPGRPVRYYRPLFMAALTLGYQAFGEDPVGYHALCLALHLGCGALLWRLARELGLPVFARVTAVLLFLLHPLQIQSAAWISALSEPLLGLAAMACVLSWMRWLRTRGRRALLLSLSLFAAALLILERAIALAFVLWLVGWYRHALLDAPQLPAVSAAPPLRARLRAGVVQGLVLALPPLAVFALRRIAIGPSAVAPASWLRDTLLTAPQVAVRYVRNLVLPLDLSPAYPHHFVATPTLSSVGWPLLSLVLIAGAFYLLARTAPRRAFLFGSAAVALSPALCVGLLPAHALVQDRYGYLPLAFLAMGLGELAFGGPAPQRPARLVARRALIGAWLVMVLALHAGNLEPWRDELALFTRAVEVAPQSPQFAMSLALAEHQRGVRDPACAGLGYAAAMLREHPRSGDGATIYFELGNCLREAGDRAAALRAYERSRAWAGASVLRTDVNRVLLLAELGRAADATQLAQELTRAHASAAAAWNAAAAAAAYRGDLAAAERAALRALTLDSNDAASRRLLERLRAARAAGAR